VGRSPRSGQADQGMEPTRRARAAHAGRQPVHGMIPQTGNRSRVLLGALSFAAVSWGLAASYVAWNDWFGAGDLPAFAFWSLLLTLPAYPILRVFENQANHQR